MKIKRKVLAAHMRAARSYAECSYCERLKVGTVIQTKSGSTYIGYNGTPAGEPNVCEVDGVTHPDVRHSEVNALKKLTRSTESSVGSIAVTTHAPCRQCAIDLADAGIEAVVFGEFYRSYSGIEYLVKKGVRVYRYEVETDMLFLYNRVTETFNYNIREEHIEL